MSISTQHSFSSVLSVNSYNNTYISGVSSFLSQNTSAEFAKDQFAISYLNTKDFINAQIEISKNIPDEDIYDAINTKVYDELALDQAIEYQIQYIETFNSLDEDNRHFHVFVVDPLLVTQIYADVIDTIKYLDIIIPTPLLIKSLYSKEIIDSNGVHCFVYIQEDDAFVTIYGEREFIYTKAIKYSLLDMYEKFCELYGNKVEYSDFIDFYTNHSLKTTQSDYKEFFIRLYKELFANVNDILTYAKRAFDIEKFEHVYIGSQLQTVTKLDEMLEVELNIKSSEFNFSYDFEDNGTYTDELHALMQIYTTVNDEDRYVCNFTTYYRPPSFKERESGKLIMLTAASLILAFAYPFTYWVLTYAQTLQKDLLQNEYRELHNIKITRESTIKNKLADKKKSLALLNQEKNDYIKKKHTLVKIHEVKVNYPMKAKLLSMLSKDLNKFGVRLASLKYAEKDNIKSFNFNLLSTKDRKITKLVQYLTTIHEGELKFELNEISFDEKKKLYLSELKVNIL